MTLDAGRLWSPARERALRDAAAWHHGQTRRGSPDVPYLVHVAAVAQVLDRAGFGEEAVIAGLLHDVLEDCSVTTETLAERHGARVAELVGWCTEIKRDDSGASRPWSERKREHLQRLRSAPVDARGIVLADKLHNLVSIRLDIERGVDIWSLFHADRAEVLNLYDRLIQELGGGDPRLVLLADECAAILAEIQR